MKSQVYSPRRIRGSVNILVYSPPLRWIIAHYSPALRGIIVNYLSEVITHISAIHYNQNIQHAPMINCPKFHQVQILKNLRLWRGGGGRIPPPLGLRHLKKADWIGLRIHRRKLGGCIWLGISHKIFAQLSKKYTFSERLKNKFLKSTTNLAILIYILEIRFEMF